MLFFNQILGYLFSLGGTDGSIRIKTKPLNPNSCPLPSKLEMHCGLYNVGRVAEMLLGASSTLTSIRDNP